MRIQSCDGNTRCALASGTKEISEQQADTNYLRLLQCVRNFAQRNVRGNQCDRDFFGGQAHGKIFDAAALSKKFGLPWELETDVVHPGFVNRTGHDRIELTAPGECDRFFQGSSGSARSFNRRFARIAIWLPANDDVLGRIRDASRFQSEIDDLWSDAGAIAECNSDARFCGAHISARDRNRICSIAHPSCAPLWLGKRAAIRGKDRRLTLGGRGKAEIRSEGLDVSLCAKAGDPAFLYPLCFHLE